MKKQRLLENENPKFRDSIFLIFFLIYLSIIFSFVKTKLLKFKSIEKEVFFSGFFTLAIELCIVSYLFFRYPDYFSSLFKKNFRGFFKGIGYYLISVPFLSFLVFISFLIFKKIGFEPAPQEIIFLYLQTNSISILIFLFILSVFFAPFFEEIIFRGFIYPSFKEKFHAPFSIITSSLIFSLFHQDIFVAFGIFVLGIILTYIFEKTENLWICIGLHFSNNFFANISIFLLKFFLQ